MTKLIRPANEQDRRALRPLEVVYIVLNFTIVVLCIYQAVHFLFLDDPHPALFGEKLPSQQHSSDRTRQRLTAAVVLLMLAAGVIAYGWYRAKAVLERRARARRMNALLRPEERADRRGG